MGVEVAEHGITAPATDDTYFVRVDAGEEECHGTASAKRAGSNLVRVNTGMTGNGQGGSAEETRDHRRGDS